MAFVLLPNALFLLDSVAADSKKNMCMFLRKSYLALTTEILKNVLFIICINPPHFCIKVVSSNLFCYPSMGMQADTRLFNSILWQSAVSFLYVWDLADWEMTHNVPAHSPCSLARERERENVLNSVWSLTDFIALSCFTLTHKKGHISKEIIGPWLFLLRGCSHHSLCFYSHYLHTNSVLSFTSLEAPWIPTHSLPLADPELWPQAHGHTFWWSGVQLLFLLKKTVV